MIGNLWYNDSMPEKSKTYFKGLGFNVDYHNRLSNSRYEHNHGWQCDDQFPYVVETNQLLTANERLLVAVYNGYKNTMEKNHCNYLGIERFFSHVARDEIEIVRAGRGNIMFGVSQNGVFTPSHASIRSQKNFVKFLKNATNIAFCVLPAMAKMLRKLGYWKIAEMYNCQHGSTKILLCKPNTCITFAVTFSINHVKNMINKLNQGIKQK